MTELLIGLLAAAAALGGLALLVNRRARRAEREHPPVGQFLEVGGVRLHYVEKGRGRPVVLLHGNGMLIQDFGLSILDRAAERYRVIAFDRPGYGYSQRPREITWTAERQAALLLEALRRLGVERPLVVGHSWGTRVAVALALDHPGEISGVVLLSGYYYPTRRVDTLLFSVPAVPVVGPAVRNTLSPVLGRLTAPMIFRQLFAPNPVPPAFAAAFPVPLILRPSQIRASAEEAGIMRKSAAETSPRYGEIAVPVVIAAGEGDRIVNPDRQSRRLHGDIPHSSLRIVPETGHMIHHVRPAEVLEAIDLAWRQADAAAGRRQASGGLVGEFPSIGTAGMTGRREAGATSLEGTVTVKRGDKTRTGGRWSM